MGSGNNPQSYPRLWKTKISNHFNDLRYDFRENPLNYTMRQSAAAKARSRKEVVDDFFSGIAGRWSGAGGKDISLNGRVKKAFIILSSKIHLTLPIDRGHRRWRSFGIQNDKRFFTEARASRSVPDKKFSKELKNAMPIFFLPQVQKGRNLRKKIAERRRVLDFPPAFGKSFFLEKDKHRS